MFYLENSYVHKGFFFLKYHEGFFFALEQQFLTFLILISGMLVPALLQHAGPATL